MFPTSPDLSEENIAEKIALNKARQFPTAIKLFANHNGLRRNKIHTLIAPTGVGKSTFVRTMIIDFIEHNPEKKILLWLTEETKDDFDEAFVSGVSKKVLDNIECLKVISEQSLDMNETKEDVYRYLNEIVNYYDYDLVILDNITTSKLYIGGINQDQEFAAGWLKNLSKKDLALFVIAHAGGSVQENSSKLLDENDIRGNKTLPNLSEFLYILQPFYVGNRLFQFLVTKKHRNQEIGSKYIGVKYDKETKTFKDSAYVSFENLKEVFKQRNRLDG
tara:strand:- start:2734 stop:3561 length:828 start_codon:yes stop_codon:yes gene_type:complete